MQPLAQVNPSPFFNGFCQVLHIRSRLFFSCPTLYKSRCTSSLRNAGHERSPVPISCCLHTIIDDITLRKVSFDVFLNLLFYLHCSTLSPPLHLSNYNLLRIGLTTQNHINQLQTSKCKTFKYIRKKSKISRLDKPQNL